MTLSQQSNARISGPKDKQPALRVPRFRSQPQRRKHHAAPYVGGIPPQRVLVPPTPSTQASMDSFFPRTAATTSSWDFSGISQENNADINDTPTGDSEHSTLSGALERINHSSDYISKTQSGSSVGTSPLLVDKDRRKKRALDMSSPATFIQNDGVGPLHTLPIERSLSHQIDPSEHRKIDVPSWPTA
ncbi:hypothetical protein AYO20_03000 [Fonsecaea nubica]|uniref:Uncharacterized protein n=1 Tax=Fonsecaea nubica TaxID=856822 RepID=A0A178D9C7_9EURO|nr:hypothetical protein AYO20_03000 [Fonsecaea nubica]OAL37823.1 hypothetical protein AYO20_03000 [Fonsecaea nubica]